jgi:hypothetical protein
MRGDDIYHFKIVTAVTSKACIGPTGIATYIASAGARSQRRTDVLNSIPAVADLSTMDFPLIHFQLMRLAPFSVSVTFSMTDCQLTALASSLV